MYKIYADGVLIYDSKLEDYRIGKGEITLELNKSGSFTFSLYPDHFCYDTITKLKTVLKVLKGERIVFRGRSLNDVTDYWNNKVFTCEGELGFFQDSIIRPFNFSGTPAEALAKFVNEHNAQVDEFKRFKVGTVTVTGNITLANTGYETAMSNLTKLIETAGGYLHITHENGEEIPTLNWLGAFTGVSSQVVEFGENLKDYTKTVKADDIGTAVIPLGAAVDDGNSETEDQKLTIADVNDGLDYVYSEAGVSLYGWIYKTVSWDDITDPATLKARAEEYVETLVNQAITIELTAIDLHLMDKSIDSFQLGDYIRVLSLPHNFDSTLLSNKQTLNILNPANDTLTLGHSYSTFTESIRNVSAIVQNVSSIRSSVTNLSNTVGNVNTTVIEAKEKADAANASVNDLAGTVAGNTESIALLAQQMEGLGGGITFVTTEIDTGNTWIDGKPIYRQVFTGSATTSSGGVIVGEIDNLDVPIRIYGSLHRSSGAICPVNYWNASNNQCNTLIDNSGEGVLVRSSHAGSVVVVVEYTKSTD